MTRKDKDELISFFRDAEGYDREELLHEYCYNIMKDDTEFAGEIDILSVSEQGDDDTEKPVKNLQDFAKELYNKIMEGVCNVIETQDDDWIPTSERLPGPFETVLITVQEEWGWEPLVYEGARGAGGMWDVAGVTHPIPQEAAKAWMPLPEPYREDKNDGN